MTDTGLTPGDSELIAAFLDRQLTSDERRDFLERLDREPALYDVFVETVRYRDSLVAEVAAPVARHPSSGASWVIPTTVAALLALAVIGPFLVEEANILTGSGLGRALVEDNRLEGTLDGDWYEQGWRRTRGLTPIQSEVDSAFRIGVHSVDLEVALRTQRPQDATLLLRYIDSELRNVDFSDHLRLSYSELVRQLEDGQPLEQALERAASTEQHTLELLDIGYGYAFGKWAEAGKLAAQSGNQDLLRSRVFRRMLREIRDHEWTEVVDQRLDEIESMITNRDVQLDMAALEEAFTAIIDES